MTPRLIIVLTTTALIAAMLPTAPATASAAPTQAIANGTPTQAIANGTPTPSTTGPPFVACPLVRVKPNPPAPKPSPVPTHDPNQPIIGGDGLGTTGLTVPAGSPALPKIISAKSWLVADLDTGAVIGACAPHAYGAPASLQKLLLAATVMPKLNPKAVATVTAEDLNFEPGSSAVGLILKGKYTVETLWLGLLLNSGNDAANVLARLGGGAEGVKGTLAAMNAEARQLGALDTHAETPSGLDGPGQVTSVYDLALIARACFARDDFRRYAGSRTAQMPAEPPKDKHGFQIQNDNRLLFEYPGAIGGKTGFTDIARHTFVGAAERGGRRLVVTMLGGEHKPVRQWQQGAALLDWGFSVASDAGVGRLVDPGETDRLPAPTATDAPGRAGLANAAVGGDGLSARVVGVAVVSVAALFVLVWLLVLLGSRRRRGVAGGRDLSGD